MQNRLVIIGVIIYWTFHALLFAPQIYLLNLRSPAPFTWWQTLIFTGFLFYIWALLTPLIFWVGKKFPLDGRKIWRNFLILVLFGIPTITVHILLFYLANFEFMSWTRGYRNQVPISSLLVGFGATDVLVYGGILIASQAILYFERYRDREKSLAEAQLLALKTQLHPHFLFNTLNALSELVYQDAARADKSIAKLSDLLRLSLKNKQEQEVTLEEELNFSRTYVEIQQTLLQKRLKVEWKIAPETLNVCVPNMVLQPLVENSIRHGIAPRRSGGTIKIISERQKKWLILRIEDDGLGLKSNSQDGEGIGLSNIKTRLQHLYGDEQKFILEYLPEEKGVVVTLKIPFVESSNNYENSHFDY